MELNIRLSAKDVQAKGVFDALERLCLCFKPEDDKYERIQLKATAENTPELQSNKEISARVAETPVQKPEADGAGRTGAPIVSAPSVVSTAPPITAPPIQSAPIAEPQTYTLPQVTQAAAIFAETSDASRQQVFNLIHSYGVRALADIPQDKIGEFATRLRGLGARI